MDAAPSQKVGDPKRRTLTPRSLAVATPSCGLGHWPQNHILETQPPPRAPKRPGVLPRHSREEAGLGVGDMRSQCSPRSIQATSPLSRSRQSLKLWADFIGLWSVARIKTVPGEVGVNSLLVGEACPFSLLCFGFGSKEPLSLILER